MNQVNPGSDVAYIPWGLAGDIPVPGDYDGDGKTDIAIWRPSNGIWHVLQSSNWTVSYFKWGRNGDTPVVGDFDGDLRSDYVVVRTDEFAPRYLWLLQGSNFNFGFPLFTFWGTAGDRIVPGDYDGNVKQILPSFDLPTVTGTRSKAMLRML